MYVLPKEEDPTQYMYFEVAAAEAKLSTEFYIGKEACELVGEEDCTDLVAIHLPELSMSYSFAAGEEPPSEIEDQDVEICPGFEWDNEADGSLGQPKNAIITSSDESFCGRIYQFEDEYFVIKAHVVPLFESGTIVLDQDSCKAACDGDCDVDWGCEGPKTFPKYAGAVEGATTPGPEDTTEDGEDSAVFAAGFALLAMCLV
eukprot:GHVP01057253.1.p1 GENE.GHVP01057253.1~~GHVP01057253.1.p1  ORF type:complete len:202 (+),score=53.63 GHVP01057253.1:502-1107(+)